MPNISSKKLSLILPATIGFVAGIGFLGLLTGLFTGGIQESMEASRQSGYDSGYAAAKAESPVVETERAEIRIISNAVFMGTMEVELKAITRLSNAIDFTYGEKGRERQRMAALNPGSAIAQQIGDTLYVIKNVSVAANLQRATVEVTRIRLPSQHQ